MHEELPKLSEQTKAEMKAGKEALKQYARHPYPVEPELPPDPDMEAIIASEEEALNQPAFSGLPRKKK